jgi:hypothetical protein
VAKYIDDIRQSVFSTENVSLMWVFQDSIFTQSMNSLAAIASPIPRAAIAAVIPTVIPDLPEITSRRRVKGRGRFSNYGQQGIQSDLPAETGQARTQSLRPGSSDPNLKWWSCNDFNDRSGCGYPQGLCKYNHICSACADPNHGLSTHAKFIPKGVAGEIPK